MPSRDIFQAAWISRLFIGCYARVAPVATTGAMSLVTADCARLTGNREVMF